MKAAAVFVLSLIVLFPVSGLCAEPNSKGGTLMATTIRIVFGSQEVIVGMLDSPASRDFMSLLPLTVEFSDYASTEKITYLPRKLNTKGSPTAREAPGDFTYFAPWGNLAVFYRGAGSDGQLYVLGRIQSGKEKLAAMNRNFTARIEKVE